jgi:hypothetical protein
VVQILPSRKTEENKETALRYETHQTTFDPGEDNLSPEGGYAPRHLCQRLTLVCQDTEENRNMLK